MSTISPQARRELVTAVAERYRRSTPAEKGWILDEFVALTGYHRKHAIRVLNGDSATPAARRGRRSVYDEAVTEGLVVLWEASDRVCGKRLKALLPIDTDNGSEFLNEVLIGFCREHGIELTRSRPYRKNDQAWVEQKNGAVVRRLVGYGRLEGMRGAEALARLYSAARLFVNVFQPSFKLAEKTRVGARVHKRYHAPATPCARLLASDAIPAAMKDRVRALAGTLDPLGLLDEVRAVQRHLAGLAAGSTIHPMPQRDADLDGFLRSLALAWRAGEVRPTHRPRKRPPRHWRTRRDPFETTWPRVVEWLEAEPHRTAKELFDRLRREHPGMFPPGQLRTLQRRVKDWRRLAARRLVFADPIGASGGAAASPKPGADSNGLASDPAPSIPIRKVGAA